MSTSTESVFSEAMTPAEMDYFSSKGEKAEGLIPAEPVKAEPSYTHAPIPTEPVGELVEPKPNEVDDEEGIYLDENGKARSVLTGKFVPHAALHKERERRKAVESEVQTYREKMARAEERLAVLNEVLTQPAKPEGQQAPEQEEMPDPEKDIFAFVKWQAKEIDRLKQATTLQVQQTQQREAFTQMQNAYVADARKFMAEKPDFQDAYQHIAQSRARELTALGYNEQQIRAQLNHEETTIVAEAFRRGISPANVLYQQAIARGYTPKQAQQQAQASTQKLDTIAKGQSTQKSLSGAGGAPSEGLTLESLVNMSEEEYAATLSKLGKSKMRQLMGG